MKQRLVGMSLVLVLAAWSANVSAAEGPAVADLVRTLKDEQFEVRDQAIHALEKLGPKAKAAVPALVKSVREDAVAEIRFHAAIALGAIGPDARDAVPSLREALKDADRLVGVGAAEALIKIDPGSQDAALAVLLDTLKVWPEEVPPVFVYRALSHPGFKTRAAETAVLRTVRDPQVRLLALDTLAHMRADQEAVVWVLMGVVKDRSSGLQMLQTVWSGGHPHLAPLVTGQLDPDRLPLRVLVGYIWEIAEMNHVNRLAAVGMLGKLGPKAAPAIPALRECLAEKSLRAEADKALRRIGARP